MKRAFQGEVQGIAVVMVMVTTILNVSATKRRTLVMDAVQGRVPRMATAAATTAQPLQRKTRRTMGAHLASVKERALLKNHKNRVLPLVTSMIAVRVLNTQDGASAQEDHSAMVMYASNAAQPTVLQPFEWQTWSNEVAVPVFGEATVTQQMPTM